MTRSAASQPVLDNMLGCVIADQGRVSHLIVPPDQRDAHRMDRGALRRQKRPAFSVAGSS
jgi:hypothetical protein